MEDRKTELQVVTNTDRAALIHAYRVALNLYGDPSQADSLSNEEMVQAILEREVQESLAHS